MAAFPPRRAEPPKIDHYDALVLGLKSYVDSIRHSLPGDNRKAHLYLCRQTVYAIRSRLGREFPGRKEHAHVLAEFKELERELNRVLRNYDPDAVP